ncbi:MAG: PD40 domain-containing protein [Deltaproteobacteria bacterium]|nr:PD40 domain-containing protein [Deltaproteobacteria bacterium]
MKRRCLIVLLLTAALAMLPLSAAVAIMPLTGPYDWGNEGAASTYVDNILQITPAGDQWDGWVTWYNSEIKDTFNPGTEDWILWNWEWWFYYSGSFYYGDANVVGGQDWAQCWGAYPWSADGQWIIYSSTIPYLCPMEYYLRAHHAICRIHPDGTGYEQLTTNDAGETHGSFLGADNDTIIFKRGPSIWKKDLLADFLLRSGPTDAGETNLTEVHRYEPGILHGEWGELEEALELKDEILSDEDLLKEDGGQPAEGKPVPSPDGTKIAFQRQGTIWVMDADGANAVHVAGKRVDIPVETTLLFDPNDEGGFDVSTPGECAWEEDMGAPLDICCGEYPDFAQISFDRFVFPFADKTYGYVPMTTGDPDLKNYFMPYDGDGYYYISPNGHVSLGGNNDMFDEGCNCGGPDKLLNAPYARIAPFWTHLARHLQIEDCYDPECPDYAVYINAFSNMGESVIETEVGYEGCIDQCEYDYFSGFAQGYEGIIDRVVITWYQMKLIDNDKRLTFQLQLFGENSAYPGRIIMSYKFDGTDDYEINSGKKVLIGLAPGYNKDGYESCDKEDPNSWILEPAGIDYTADLPYNSGSVAAIYELFYKIHGATKHSWSPDSQWVLFNGSPGCAVFPDIFEGEGRSYCEGGKQRIFKVQPDGYGLVMLSDLGESGLYENNWATWSPDGQWIAYHERDFNGYRDPYYDGSTFIYDDIYRLMIMRSDGSDKRPLVEAQYDEERTQIEPPVEEDWVGVCGPTSWSPDSQWITFKRSDTLDHGDGGEISIINIDTLEIIPLTTGYDDYRMWWSPNSEVNQILFRDVDDWGYSRDGIFDEDFYNYDSDDLLVINFHLPVDAIPGDIDGDGDVDMNDLYLLLSHNGQSSDECPLCDMNGDGVISVTDARALIAMYPALARDRRVRLLLR